MLHRVGAILLLLPLCALAQPQDELKALRVSLEKLERGQKALIALTRIGIDTAKLAELQVQRRQLLDRELELSKRAAPSASNDSGAAQQTLVSLGPNGQTEIVRAAPAHAGVESSRTLADVRRERQTLDESIDTLRRRIAAWEKYFDAIVQEEAPPVIH